nr:MAG TPA: Translation initiation factor IF-2, N-terminal region [Caudoviricetes sp.]
MIMEIKMNRTLTLEELAEEMGLPVEKIKRKAFEEGIIDELGNPTKMAIEKGLCVDPSSIDDSEPVYEYIKTLDMSIEEQEKWEKEEKGCALYGVNEGVIEFSKSYSYPVDKNMNRIPGAEIPDLFIAVKDDFSDSEVCIILSSKNDIRKLRDYLNNYLEDNL